MRTANGNMHVAFTLLLSLAAASVSVSLAARVSASAGGPAPLPLVENSKELGLPGLPIIPPIFGGGDTDPDLLRCVKSLVGAEDCVTGLLGSLLSGKISLPKECCNAIEGMSEHCFSTIFAIPVFGSVFPGLVKSFCAAPVPVPCPPSASKA